MADLNTIVSRSKSIVGRKTGSEYVLIPVSNNIADMESVFTINETGAFIWEQMDGKKSIEELTNLLMEEYEVDYQTALADITGFVETMRDYLVIETA
jgi:methyltransferase-like protein